jgi:hypothetical protein
VSRDSKESNRAEGAFSKDALQIYFTDILYTLLFLITIVLPSQWTGLWEWILGSEAFTEALKQFWYFATCTLCCRYMPSDTYDPWFVLYEKQPINCKIFRVFFQFLTAIFLALVIAAVDQELLPDRWDFKTEFLGAFRP